MKKFYTITDEDTQNTNSRSQRFDSFEDAVAAATDRIVHRQGDNRAVVILVSEAVVSPIPPCRPVKVERIGR